MEDDISALLDEVERKYCSSKATPTTTSVSKGRVSMVNPHSNHKTTPTSVYSYLAANSSVAAAARSDNDIIGDDDDLEKIFSEIISDTADTVSDSAKVLSGVRLMGKRHTTASDHSVSTERRRCYPMLLAGTDLPQGHSDSHSRRACDQLRCTSCDFHVISFDNHTWNSSSNYLFFRNCMPDTSKLRENLVSRKGCRAYACQCSWRSVTSVEELGRAGQPEEGRGVREGREGGERRRNRRRGECDPQTTAPSLHALKWVCGRHGNK